MDTLPVPVLSDFTLVQGGPLFQAFIRAHLTSFDMRLLGRRILFFVIVGWLPLALLTALHGDFIAGAEGIPFLYDLGAHARLLLAVPLLLIAEVFVHQRLGLLVNEFTACNLVPEARQSDFRAAVEAAFRLRNSILAEVVMLAAIYAVAVFVIWPYAHRLPTETWYVAQTADGTLATPAGYWHCFVSLPLFQFLMLRWYYRIFVWGRFLFQVSRIPLNLVPTHPDHAAGLGFLEGASSAFVPLVLAHGVLLAGVLGNRILYLGKSLADFKAEIVAMALFMQALVCGPLLLFAVQLARTKRHGVVEYGRLADHYVRSFDDKWLRVGAPRHEPLLGSADVQSLADMGNSFSFVRDMKPFPITRDALLRVAVATLLPLTPLLLTLMSAEQLVKTLFGMLL